MSVKAFVYNSWVGGQATDKKVGIASSFADSQSLDFRTSPSQMSVLPMSRRADNGTVVDLVQNEVMTEAGDIYAIGSEGYIYRIDPSGMWTTFGNIGGSGTFGIDYRKDQDSIYIAGNRSVSSITTVSTSPTLNVRYYGESQSTYDNSDQTGFNVNSNQSDGNTTTKILTTYTSGAQTQTRYFQTDIQPISKVGVNIVSKGTGDWTLTVYDGLGSSLGTATVTNSTLTTGWNYFVFSTPIQVNVGPNNAQTYNFSVISTVADGTVSSTTMNDLSSCDMQLWASRLVDTNNGIHPMVTFQQFECIGNGRYLSVWEPLGDPTPDNSEWQRQKLSFPPGYEVCGLAVFNEYLVIATELTTTGDNTPQQGIIFYWDGLSDTYNYFTQIPEGSPESLHQYENAIYYVAGGNWYTITSVDANPQKIRRLPGSENNYTDSNVQTHVNPYMGAVRYGVHLLGWPSTTTNTSIPFGVYTWGQTDVTQPYSFGYSYVLSTGDQYINDTNGLTIGMVKNFGNVMHISWLSNGTYGVDVVDASSRPASFAKWESLIEDFKIPTKQHQASYVEAKWPTIQDGVSIVLKYSVDRGDWIYSEPYSNENLWSVEDAPNYARFDVGTENIEERFYEVQCGVDIYCDDTVTEPPVIVGVSLWVDDLAQEQGI